MKLSQNAKIGHKIQEFRKSKGYSQVDVVAKMHLLGSTISESGYAKLEQGRRNLFIEDFIILKIILEFEYASIFDETESMIRKRQSE